MRAPLILYFRIGEGGHYVAHSACHATWEALRDLDPDPDTCPGMYGVSTLPVSKTARCAVCGDR